MKRILAVILAALVPSVLWSFSIAPSLLIVLSLFVLFVSLRGLRFVNAFRLGVLYGMVLYGVSLSWIWAIFSAPAIALWLIIALFPGLACGFIAVAQQHGARAWWLSLYAALVWTGLEYFRCEWFTLRFPWMTPGTAIGPIGLTPWIGVYGVSFVATWLAFSLEEITSNGWRRAKIGVLLLLLLIPLWTDFKRDPSRAVPVMAIQSENCDFFTYLERFRESDFRDGIVLWPENSSLNDTRLARTGRETTSYLDRLIALAKERNVTVIFGQSRLQDETKFNEALTVDGSGIFGSHDKNRPVHFMNDGTPGTRAIPVRTPWGNIGTPICFDNDYTEIPRVMAAAGAEVFLVPSMDAERWSRRQHWQHAELFRLRAAETGRWYVVCATSGMTQTISPDGKRRDALPLMQDGILRTTVYTRDENTWYVRHGWRFPQLVLALAMSATLALLVYAKRRKRVDNVSSALK